MQNKRIYVPELKRWVRLTVSTRALRSINRDCCRTCAPSARRSRTSPSFGRGVPILSAAAGSLLDTSRERISVRRILAYAAGIGATGSPALDDDREGGVVAMPPFCVSLEWPVVSGARARDGLGAAGPERYRGVHASQDSFFHRPIRPGDDLETRGRIASVEPTRRRAGIDEDRDGGRRDR